MPATQTQPTTYQMQTSNYQIPTINYQIQNTNYQIPNTTNQIPNAKCIIPNTKHQISNTNKPSYPQTPSPAFNAIPAEPTLIKKDKHRAQLAEFNIPCLREYIVRFLQWA